MRFDTRRPRRLLPILFLAAAQCLATNVFAADNRNDGNTHDTREGPVLPESQDSGPASGDSCLVASPVLIRNGEFIWSDTDVVLNGRPLLSLSRYYRSYDSRDGIFGKGWSTRCEKALIRVLDYVADDPESSTSPVTARITYVHRLTNGRRYEFVESSPGVFATPDGLPGKTLTLDADGTPTIENIDGSIERYDRIGKLVAEIDRNANAVNYEYESGVLARIADENGRFLALGYDSTGYVASVTDHTDRSWLYAYNPDGTLASVTDPAGGIRRYEYQTVLRAASAEPYPMITRVIDASAIAEIGVTYAEDGKVASYTVGSNTFTYTTRRGFTYKTDSLGAEWAYETDENGLKTAIYPPINRGAPERFEYDENGQVVKFVDISGTEFSREVDPFGRVVSATTPDGTSTIEYEENRIWPTATVSPSGRRTELQLDARGNPVRITDPQGNVLMLRWNASGDLLSVTNPLGAESSRVVDALGLPTMITDASGISTSRTYDIRGNLSSIVDALGFETAYEYDVLDRLVEERNALGGTTTYAYDDAGRMLSVTDPSGFATVFVYDRYGRIVSETRPDGSTIRYAYRLDNLLESSTDPEEVTTTYGYDRSRRLTSISADREQYTYGYDLLGRVIQARSRAITVSMTYDSMHRPITETQGRSTVGYEYNVDGEVTAIEVAGERWLYEYDRRGLMTSFTTPSGTHRYEHDPAGRLVSQTLPNGAAVSVRYDPAGRLLAHDYSQLGGDVYGYGYDEIGRLVQMSDGRGLDRVFSYDAAQRVVSADGEQQYAYQYDALGNRLEAGGIYDPFNKLLENTTHSFTYDTAGRMVSMLGKSDGEEVRFAWNALGRLASVESVPAASTVSASSTTFAYDAFGRRVEKRVGREVTAFGWSGASLVAEFSSSALSAVYRYDGGLTADEYTDASGTYFVHTSSPGMPLALSDVAGELVQLDRPGPYGERSANPEPDELASPFNQVLPGQYADRETDLNYNHFRYYMPDIGRYISPDPIGLEGGLNAYNYAGGNPVMNFDPYGLDCVATGSDVVCTVPDTEHTVAFPRPEDWPDTIGPGSWNYHFYNESVPLEGAGEQCVQEAIQNAPTPGFPRPASAVGTRNNATPTVVQGLFDTVDLISSLGNDPGGYNNSPVLSYTRADGSYVVNVTQPGHPLHPGYVLRTIEGAQVNNYGEGLGWLQGSPNPLAGFVNGVWQGQTQGLINGCQCRF